MSASGSTCHTSAHPSVGRLNPGVGPVSYTHLGAFGAGLGIIGAVFLPGVVGDPITVSAWAVAGAVVVAMAIGVIFGVRCV